MDEIENPIIIEQAFNASKKEMWDAITQLSQMKQWFFSDIPAFEPVTGFYTEFDVRSGERNFRHQWKIIEVVPLNLIKYQWSYEEYTGVGFVTFELLEKGTQTILHVINEGLDSFPQEIPEFSRSSCESGWIWFIKNSLKEFMERNVK